MKLVISPQAAAEIEVASTWWKAHRPKSPGLLEQELLDALEFISSNPDAGAPLRNTRLSGVRRVPLLRARYLLYYRVLSARQEVRVLRFWHARRGAKPAL